MTPSTRHLPGVEIKLLYKRHKELRVQVSEITSFILGCVYGASAMEYFTVRKSKYQRLEKILVDIISFFLQK